MKRFFKLMSITIQGRMYYRAGFVFNLITPLLLLGSQFLLWRSIYGLRDDAALGDYGRADMYSYILIAFCINSLLTWSSENVLSREIRTGAVVSRRIRPIGFLSQSLADMCGNMVIQAVVNFTMVGAAFAIFHRHLTLPSLSTMPLFLLSLIMAMILRMMLVSCFSLLCFFSTGHLGLTWTRTALTEFFSGALIPVALFPGWLQTVTVFTPFPLMLEMPIALFLGREPVLPIGLGFALQAIWIAVFIGLHALIYSRVSKTATLAGG